MFRDFFSQSFSRAVSYTFVALNLIFHPGSIFAQIPNECFMFYFYSHILFRYFIFIFTAWFAHTRESRFSPFLHCIRAQLTSLRMLRHYIYTLFAVFLCNVQPEPHKRMEMIVSLIIRFAAYSREQHPATTLDPVLLPSAVTVKPNPQKQK